MSKLATQILNQLVAKGLIAKNKPFSEQKFKPFKKGKKKTKFGKPDNSTHQHSKASSTAGNNTSKKNLQKKHEPHHPQSQSSNQAQTKKRKTKKRNSFKVVGKVARIFITKDGLKLSNYTERELIPAKAHMRVTKTGKLVRPADSSANYPDVVPAPFEPRGTHYYSDPIRTEVREELSCLQVVELPLKQTGTIDEYVPVEEHSDHGEEDEVFIGIKSMNADFSSTLVGGGTKSGSTKKRQLKEAA